MTYTAVIFDLDGTLVNSLEDLADSANEMLTAQGYPTHSVPEYKYFVGNGSRKLIERNLPEDQRSETNLNACLEIYKNIYARHQLNKTYAYAGMPQVVQTLKARGLKLAVCTNKHVSAATVVLEALYGKGTFTHLVADRPGTNFKRKPDPTNVLKLAAELGVTPAQVAYVGDSSVDMETATRAGFLPVGCLWGFRTQEELLQSGAQILLTTPAELLTKVPLVK